jgi:hypothetical protein
MWAHVGGHCRLYRYGFAPIIFSSAGIVIAQSTGKKDGSILDLVINLEGRKQK